MAGRSGRLGRLHAPETGAALFPDESRIPTAKSAVLGMLEMGGAGGQLASRLERKLGISTDEAWDRVDAYRQFLALKAASFDVDATKLSPPPLIDRVWHEHVLDTKHYAPPCLAAQGALPHVRVAVRVVVDGVAERQEAGRGVALRIEYVLVPYAIDERRRA